MSSDLTPHRMPWDVEAVPEPLSATVRALQRDMAYMVTHTAVMVHSNRPELRAVVNTPRGQIIPRGTATATDGTTIEFQDIGMPQPGAKTMTVQELVESILHDMSNLGVSL